MKTAEEFERELETAFVGSSTISTQRAIEARIRLIRSRDIHWLERAAAAGCDYCDRGDPFVRDGRIHRTPLGQKTRCRSDYIHDLIAEAKGER
jgi:hypothetical protein